MVGGKIGPEDLVYDRLGVLSCDGDEGLVTESVAYEVEEIKIYA